MALGLLALAMYISCIFHVVCVSFTALAMQELADAKADSSRIQALVIDVLNWASLIVDITILIRLLTFKTNIRGGNLN